MCSRAVFLAVALIVTSLDAKGADLVVWWEEGGNPEEDSAVREIVAAFEHTSGEQVELVFHPYPELPSRIVAAFEAGGLPDFAIAQDFVDYSAQWAVDDRLVDLTDPIGSFSSLPDWSHLWGPPQCSMVHRKSLIFNTSPLPIAVWQRRSWTGMKG